MKKFTKGCLLTALTLLILGCAFCSIFGILGGFRQLDNLNANYMNPMSGIRWINNGAGLNLEFRDFWGNDFTNKQTLGTSQEVQTEYQASDITDMDIEIGGGNLEIYESEDDYIWIKNGSNIKAVEYGVKNGVLKIQYIRSYRFFRLWGGDDFSKAKISLYLPKGMTFDTIDMELGAGTMKSDIDLIAEEINLEAGAGTFEMEGLEARDIDISVGAGSFEIGRIDADELSMEAGAGEIIADQIAVRDLDLDVAAGSFQLIGSISGNADIECAAGSVELILEGEESDYNYDVECAMGDVSIGSNSFSGLISERYVNNGSNRKVNVDCATGSVSISFRAEE